MDTAVNVARWIWWVPLGVVAVLGALGAFRLGWIAATLTETDVITAMAQRYVTQDGGKDAAPTQCIGLPGQIAGAWITVRCGAFAYHVTRFGQLLPQEPETRTPAL